MSKKCGYEPCRKPANAKGLCSGHYRQRRLGKELRPLVGKALTIEQRFWAKVEKTPGCWTWKGSTDGKGYAQIRVNDRIVLAHRLSFEWVHGSIPDGMFIDHICHNRKCVRPDHCRLATNAENQMNLLGARSHSKSGVRGVWWRADKRRWVAEARMYGKKHWIGMYKTLEEADRAATEWRRQHMPYSAIDRRPGSGSFFMPKINEIKEKN